MKKLLLGAILLFSTLGFSQVKRQALLEEKIDKLRCLYQKKVDLDKNTTDYLVYIGFQNEKYSSIVDTKSVAFFSQEELNLFISDLKSVEKQMLLKEKVNVSWVKENYHLDLFDFNINYLYLRTTRGAEGYTTIDVKTISKLISKLSLIEYGKDELKVM